MQAALRERVELFTELAEEFCIPLASRDVTPIRYVPLGLPVVAHDVIRRPARRRLLHEPRHVPGGADEARRRAHDDDAAPHARRHPRRWWTSLARHVPAALERGGEAAQRRHAKVAEHGPALTLEHHRSAPPR